MASSYENAGQGAREMAQCVRVLATQVFGPEFESQHPCKRVHMAARSIGGQRKAEPGRSLSLASQPNHNSWFPFSDRSLKGIRQSVKEESHILLYMQHTPCIHIHW